jgi:outer membrane lipoprotein-sorting protein
MNKQSTDPAENEMPDDILQRAIASIEGETVPSGPPPELIFATLHVLDESETPRKRSLPFIPRPNIMKLITMAAGLLLAVSMASMLILAAKSPSLALGQALKQLREAHSMSYCELITVKSQQRAFVVRNFIAGDGRKRSELPGTGKSGGTITIFDAAGNIRLSLLENTRTAIVPDPTNKLLPKIPGTGCLAWLQALKKLSGKPDKELVQKELEGKRVRGFVATQGTFTFTMWVDNATGEPMRMEYDSPSNGDVLHVVMTDFRFNEELDESLFSFAVPTGYKVRQQLAPTTSKQRKATPMGLELAWSCEGHWAGVACATAPTVLYASDRLGRLVRLNQKGEELGAVKIDDTAGSIRAANLAGDGECALLTFHAWGRAVKAHNAKGKLLWSYAVGEGVDDVWAADLNGDGRDEVIIGYNGRTGLHVLDSTGRLLWKNNDVKNVWHVAAANVDGDARPVVVTTSAVGKVHIFNAEGKHLRDLEPGFYGNMVRTWQQKGNGKFVRLIIVAGTSGPKTTVAAMSPQGETRWSLELSARVANAVPCPQRSWLALALSDGSVRVVNLMTGKQIAYVDGQGEQADMAWLPAKEGDPLLVIATNVELQAYRITAAKR